MHTVSPIAFALAREASAMRCAAPSDTAFIGTTSLSDTEPPSELDHSAGGFAGQHHGESAIDLVERQRVRDHAFEVQLSGAPQVGVTRDVGTRISVAHEHTDDLLAAAEA